MMCYSRPWMLTLTHKQILILLALTIRIQGLRNVPKKNTKNVAPKRKAVVEAITHFRSRFPLANIHGIDVFEKLLSLPLITSDHCEILSQNFQNLVFQLGETCAGDEKLFYFTGKSQDIRLVPHKPSRIGLWFYELCAPLYYGGQYLLFTKLHRNDQYTPVSAIVEIWANIIKSFPEAKTLLTMDSYYLDNQSKRVLDGCGIPYIAAFTSNRFQGITKEMSKKVTNPGEWFGIHNATTSNSVVYHWSREEGVGKKWVMSNAPTKTRSRTIGNLVPLFDLYKVTFSCCDHFNKSLHGTTWPFRKGGYQRSGGQSAEYNFLLTCILHNTFNCFFEITKRPHSELDFLLCCLSLSDQLFEHAIKCNN